MEIFCRDAKPFTSLYLCEVQFWLHIMKEHAFFMKLGFNCSDKNLIREAEKFYGIFEDLEKRSKHIKGEDEFKHFVEKVRMAVKNIFSFKRHVLHLLAECKIGGFNYPLLIDHLSREALFFLKILDKIDDCTLRHPVDSIVSENVFWLRVMADHSKFIRGLLDPSERSFVETANDFSDQFDQLHLHALDLSSMLWHFKPNNDLVRFQKDVETTAQELLNFKTAAGKLINECAILSLIPPLLADHVRREAEHFLEIIAKIQRNIQVDHHTIVSCD